MTTPHRSALSIQRDVLYALLLREVGSRFGKTRVGLMWSLLEPVAHMAFPIVLFGLVLGREFAGVDYPLLLAWGLLPFVLFKNICLQTMEGTAASRGLLSYRQVHLMDVFIARALSLCAVEGVVFVLLFVGLALLGYDIVPARPLELLGTLAVTVLFAFGLGLVLAALTSFVPDAKAIVKVIFLPLYFASGVLFPISRFPSEWLGWLSWNPVAHLLEMVRYAGIAHYPLIDMVQPVFPFGLMLALVFAGLALYRLRALARVTA